MNTHNFAADQRVLRFPLSISVKVILCYHSTLWYHPCQGNWEELQEIFRTQVSKIGNTREQLFHAWRSFHLNEKAETIDAYVQRIREVAAMLNYGKPQILEVFKSILP